MIFESSLGIGRLHLLRGDRDRAVPALATALRAVKALNDPGREEAVHRAVLSISAPTNE